MDIDTYLKQIPSHRRVRFDQIMQIISELYPDASLSMKYKMPTFEYRQGWVAVANQKSYISLYTCMEQHIADFKRLYPGIKTGKGCLNFRDRDSIPLNDLALVVKNALEYEY